MNDRLFGEWSSSEDGAKPRGTGGEQDPGDVVRWSHDRGPVASEAAGPRDEQAGTGTGAGDDGGVERMTVEIRPARPIPTETHGSAVTEVTAAGPEWLRDEPAHGSAPVGGAMQVAGPNGSPAVAVSGGSQPIRRWDVHRGARLDDLDRRPDRLPDRAEVPVPRQEREERDQGPGWYEIPVMLLLAFTLAFLLRTFVVQVFWIPSASMVDTLEVNDRIAVEKLSYRFGDIERGEVVVFAGDEAFGAGRDMDTTDRILTGIGQFLGVVPVDAQDFVKRVIGLPGDHVEIVDGRVSVNGVELDEDYAMLDSSNGEWDVPADKLFVLGDNRANSGDSRTSLGFIDTEDVVGRAVARIWPPSRIGSVDGVDWEPIPDAN